MCVCVCVCVLKKDGINPTVYKYMKNKIFKWYILYMNIVDISVNAIIFRAV